MYHFRSFKRSSVSLPRIHMPLCSKSEIRSLILIDSHGIQRLPLRENQHLETTHHLCNSRGMYQVRFIFLTRPLVITSSCTRRFARAAENWANSQVKQSTNRATCRIPSVAEFITMRRHTIGGAMVEGLIDLISYRKRSSSLTSSRLWLAMVEYSLGIDLPDFVFEHPIIRAMSDATTDIMTWPNVSVNCVSFSNSSNSRPYRILSLSMYGLHSQLALHKPWLSL